VGRQLAAFFTDHDMLLTPTLAQPPIAIGAMDMMDDRGPGRLPATCSMGSPPSPRSPT